jgi:hypothetical protein
MLVPGKRKKNRKKKLSWQRRDLEREKRDTEKERISKRRGNADEFTVPFLRIRVACDRLRRLHHLLQNRSTNPE